MKESQMYEGQYSPPTNHQPTEVLKTINHYKSLYITINQYTSAIHHYKSLYIRYHPPTRHQSPEASRPPTGLERCERWCTFRRFREGRRCERFRPLFRRAKSSRVKTWDLAMTQRFIRDSYWKWWLFMGLNMLVLWDFIGFTHNGYVKIAIENGDL